MPYAMHGPIQSVEINDTLYVGGGFAYWSDKEHFVMAYSIESCQWHTLPKYSTKGFAMTTINNKLVLVGGRVTGFSDRSELGEWQSDSNQWTRPYPPMSRTRYNPSVTSYKNFIVVAGGYKSFRLIDSVEVLDVFNMQWSAGPSTPTPWERMVSTKIGDIWYLMGGHWDNQGFCPDVYSISLEDVISYRITDSYNDIFSMWNKLPSISRRYSSPLNIGGSLLAVGGVDMNTDEPVSVIQCYNPESNAWVQAGELPHVLWNCSCIMTSKQIYVMGGKSGFSIKKEMFIANI